MATRLECDVDGCAARLRSRRLQCQHFSMRPAGAHVPALADHSARPLDDTAHAWIRIGGKQAAGREFQRPGHMSLVLRLEAAVRTRMSEETTVRSLGLECLAIRASIRASAFSSLTA